MSVNLKDALDELQEMRHLDSDEGVANAQFKIGVGYLQRGKLDQADESLDEAHYLCGKLENHVGRAHVAKNQALIAEQRGQLDAALEKIDEALAVFEEQCQEEIIFDAREMKARMLHQAGRSQESAELLSSMIARADQAEDEVTALLLLQYLAPVLRSLGRLEEALANYRRYGFLAEKLGEPQRVALAYVGVGTLEEQLGRPHIAVGALEEAVKQFEALGMPEQAAQAKREIMRLTEQAKSCGGE